MYEEYENALREAGYQDDSFNKTSEGFYILTDIDAMWQGWRLCKKYSAKQAVVTDEVSKFVVNNVVSKSIFEIASERFKQFRSQK